MKITGSYKLHTISCIELTMKEIFTPSNRSIPRLLKRVKPVQATDIKKTIVKKRNVLPVKVNLKDLNSDSLEAKQISVPVVEDLNVIPEEIISAAPQWTRSEPVSGFITSKNYYDMVRMKIEQNKQYPERSKVCHQQGRVIVSFIIDQQGRLSSLRIVKGSRFNALDRAALEAVRKSAPFSEPPVALFKKPLHLELTILFELT